MTAACPRSVVGWGAHASQIHEPDKLDQRIREWAKEAGESIGAEAAERFRVIVVDDDAEEGPTEESTV